MLNVSTRAWLLLMAFTLLTWFLHEAVTAVVVIYLLIVLTTVKVYVIEWAFMEVARTGATLRRFFLIWPAAIAALFAGAIAIIGSGS